MTKPRSAYFLYTASNPVYCGVNPHLLATFTIMTTLPLYCDRWVSLPSMSLTVKSRGLADCFASADSCDCWDSLAAIFVGSLTFSAAAGAAIDHAVVRATPA